MWGPSARRSARSRAAVTSSREAPACCLGGRNPDIIRPAQPTDLATKARSAKLRASVGGLVGTLSFSFSPLAFGDSPDRSKMTGQTFGAQKRAKRGQRAQSNGAG